MKQNRQRGYVVIYVVVGVILAAIALATLYGLRQLSAQNQVVSSAENTATTEQQKDTKDTKADKTSTEQKKNEKSDSDEKKDTSSAQVKKPAQQQPQQHAQHQPPAPAQNNGHGSSHLPTTGPADSLAVGFVLGLIVAVGFAYRRSMLVV